MPKRCEVQTCFQVSITQYLGTFLKSFEGTRGKYKLTRTEAEDNHLYLPHIQT